MLIGYVLTLLVTKNGGSEAWGQYMLAYSVLQIVSILAKFGIDTASIRFISEFFSRQQKGKMKDYYYKAVSIVVVTSLVLSVLIYLAAPLIGTYVFHKDYMIRFMQLLAIGVLPQSIIDLHAEMFKGIKKPGVFAFFKFSSTHVSTIIFLGVFWLLSMHAIDGWTAFKATITGLWLAAIVVVALWHLTARFGSEAREFSLNNKVILSTSGPMMITMSILLIMGWTDTLFLGSLLKDTKGVGVYNVASKISTTIALALMAVNSVSTPRYAEFYSQNQMDKVKKVIRQSTRLVFWISLPLCLVCIFFPKPILAIFGEEFKIGATALVLLTLGRFISSFCGSVGYLLQMTGHQKIMQNIMFFALAICFVLNYLLIPIYGINGAAFATMFSIMFWNVVGAYYIKKKLNLVTVYYPKFVSNLFSKSKGAPAKVIKSVEEPTVPTP